MNYIASFTATLSVASQNVLPIVFSKLTEREVGYSATLESVIKFGLLLLLREVKTLEFIQKGDVSEVTILTAGD